MRACYCFFAHTSIHKQTDKQPFRVHQHIYIICIYISTEYNCISRVLIFMQLRRCAKTKQCQRKTQYISIHVLHTMLKYNIIILMIISMEKYVVIVRIYEHIFSESGKCCCADVQLKRREKKISSLNTIQFFFFFFWLFKFLLPVWLRKNFKWNLYFRLIHCSSSSNELWRQPQQPFQ